MNRLIAEAQNRDLTQLNILEEYLKKNEIEYTRIDENRSAYCSWLDRHQIYVPSPRPDEYKWDVICQYGSYGGEEGLLEIMGCIVDRAKTNDRVEGHLTAEDVIERIEKYDKN